MVKKTTIRITNCSKKRMEVCKHISINGVLADETHEVYEFEEDLNIYCRQCKRSYHFKVLVN